MDNNQIIKQPFGLNIALPKKTIKEVKKTVKQEFENYTVNPVLDFFSRNYSVSPKELTEDLRKAQSQIYTLGQFMREGQAGSTFNVKF